MCWSVSAKELTIVYYLSLHRHYTPVDIQWHLSIRAPHLYMRGCLSVSLSLSVCVSLCLSLCLSLFVALRSFSLFPYFISGSICIPLLFYPTCSFCICYLNSILAHYALISSTIMLVLANNTHRHHRVQQLRADLCLHLQHSGHLH